MPKIGPKSIAHNIPATILPEPANETPVEVLQFDDAVLTVWNGTRFISWQRYVWEQLRKHYPERTVEPVSSDDPPF